MTCPISQSREDADDDQRRPKTLVDVITDCVGEKTWDQERRIGCDLALIRPPAFEHWSCPKIKRRFARLTT